MSRRLITHEIKLIIRDLKAHVPSIKELCESIGTTRGTLDNIQAGKYKSCPEVLYHKIYEAADRYGIKHLPVEHATEERGEIGDDLTDPDSDPYVKFAPETDEEHAEDDDSYDPLFNSLIVAWNRIRTEADRCGLVALAYQLAADSGKEV